MYAWHGGEGGRGDEEDLGLDLVDAVADAEEEGHGDERDQGDAEFRRAAGGGRGDDAARDLQARELSASRACERGIGRRLSVLDSAKEAA